MVFPVVMYGCESWDCEEGWAPKNRCFWTVVLEKTLESPLDCKEIQPVRSEGDQPWDFFGKNDVKAETPVLWPPHAKSWLIGKDSDAGRDWGAGGEGDDRGWDGWDGLTRWTWVWVNSGSWWCTGRPGMLRFMGSQRVGHDWATDLIWLCCLQDIHLNSKEKHRLKLKGWKKMLQASGSQKTVGTVILIPDKIDFKPKKGDNTQR